MSVLALALVVAALVSCSTTHSAERPSVHAAGTERSIPRPVSAAGAVAGLPPFVLAIAPWEPPVNGGPPGSVFSTPNYELYSTLEDGWLAANIPAFLESSLTHYSSALAPLPRPQEPMETFIFSEREQWQDFTKHLLPGDAGVYLALGKGGFTTEGRSVLYDIGRWDTLCIAAHEGWHQYAQLVFAESLPAWLDEGIATYMEGCRFERSQSVPEFMPWRNFERFNELRRCVRMNRLMSLRTLLTTSPQACLNRGREELLAYYAQVWALTHFLVEGADARYRAAIGEVLRDAREGTLGRTMLRSPHLGSIADRKRAVKATRGLALAMVYFNHDLNQLESEYSAFLEQIASRGSGSAIARGRSPLTLAPRGSEE